MKVNYLICYDIRDEKRLARVYRTMKQVGAHIQYSVFHCRLTWPELLQLKGTLKALIKEDEDDVRVYPLPAEMKVTVMGCGDRVPEGVDLFL
jgi:CRISPR-associated protein Cas2